MYSLYLLILWLSGVCVGIGLALMVYSARIVPAAIRRKGQS